MSELTVGLLNKWIEDYQTCNDSIDAPTPVFYVPYWKYLQLAYFYMTPNRRGISYGLV